MAAQGRKNVHGKTGVRFDPLAVRIAASPVGQVWPERDAEHIHYA